MKSSRSITACFLVAIIQFSAVFASAEENGEKRAQEELCGCWINEDYDKKENHARWDFNPDGTWDSYGATTSESPAWEGTYIISAKWSDEKGNVWYKIFWQDTVDKINGYGLIRIDPDKHTLEAAHSSWFYPHKIDRNQPFYGYAGIFHH